MEKRPWLIVLVMRYLSMRCCVAPFDAGRGREEQEAIIGISLLLYYFCSFSGSSAATETCSAQKLLRNGVVAGQIVFIVTGRSDHRTKAGRKAYQFLNALQFSIGHSQWQLRS